MTDLGTPENQSSSNNVWYFAYGSNMNKITMERRNFKPQQSHPARLSGYCLSMGLRGLPYIEPAFATVIKREDLNPPPNVPDVHGVVHLITKAEFRRIVLSEGGNGHKGFGYQQKDVLVSLVDEKGDEIGTVVGTTLVTPISAISPEYWPSKRYLDLCVSGAKAHRVPETYVEWLAAHDCYDSSKSTLAKTVGKYVAMGLALPSSFVMLFVTICFVRWDIQPPWILAKAMQSAFFVHQTIHTWLFRHLFGSGVNHLDLHPKKK
ncbi:hypothetical protein BCR33DRAFT_718430 [Rhizoclosmatium globosum]|uniref:gamma-glutamylcyclotransferase n=1 Tax=Rhizoclosmatium globosum TaxID=329046 RepID=A0A1Y2C7E5_9FUNG|nr:hypothetical protein BCR33DRAFT_718430 [Rhizoclosmatium globosum]|eukprot:ORY42235.1 hypothetical protein BCR33DRAFT_718430 [Rhizoclosmatium globosum]